MTESPKHDPLIQFAEDELNRVISEEPDEYEVMLRSAILELVALFSKQEHSGMSASFTKQIFYKLVSWEPLTPLQGTADEWNYIADEDDKPLYQNRRCPRVFKKGTEAYDIEAIVFETSDGSHVTNQDSRAYITFPYTPTTTIKPHPTNEND